MAIVKVYFCKDADSVMKYVLKGRSPDDITDSEGVMPEAAAHRFKTDSQFHNPRATNQCVHVIQSWSEKDSQKLSPSEFNAIGKQMISEYWPGHEFVIKTHTDTGKIHNHIVVNTVNLDTWKRIESKRRHLYELRERSDKICKENGLSVIDQAAKERRAQLPDKVRQMERFGKRSWLLDLVQKVDLAREYATSYDELSATLSEFNIRASIEEKNITYFHSGRTRGKRGSKLGKNYDKVGLEEAFSKNREKYRNEPDAQLALKAKIIDLKNQPSVSVYKKVPRAERKSVAYSDKELERFKFPISELRKAKGSILEYCKRNNIALTTNAQGQTVMKGREHVRLLNDCELINTKNGVHGSLIDLVAIHKNMSFLEAVAHINSNPNILLLEAHLGEVKRTFTSFYIPKQEQMDLTKAALHLDKFFFSKGAQSKAGELLLKSGNAQVHQNGMFRIFSTDEEHGADVGGKN